MRISPKQKREVARIARKHDLKLVVLFGSFATGENRPESDMDIAVLGKRDVSFEVSVDLINDFMKVFHENVDLSVINKANPLLLQQISQSAVLLFGKEKEFFSFKLLAFRRYHDYAPYFEIEKQLNSNIIKTYGN